MVLASTRALWYLTRATGLVSLALLTVSVVLGITEAVRWAHPRWPRFITAGLHKNVSLLVTAFLAVHIVTAVADSFAPIRWLDVIMPFTSAYRPVWVGLGAVAFDLLVALIVTSLLRPRLGYRAWRAVHWAAYACWPVALVHGLGTGSDTRVGWALALQAGSLAMVVVAVGWRLTTGSNVDDDHRLLGATATGLAVIGIVGFTMLGPMQTGWARRAGTPTRLLASTSPPATGAATPPAAPVPGGGSSTTPTAKPGPSGPAAVAVLALPFSASLHGSVTQTRPSAAGDTTVTIAATLGGGPTGSLTVVLRGLFLLDGGVQMRSSSAILGPTGQPSLYSGHVVSLAGSRLVAAMQGPAGQRMELTLNLQIAEGSNAVSGTATARAVAASGDVSGGG